MPAGAGVAGVGLLGADGSLVLVSGSTVCGGAASIELRMVVMQDDVNARGTAVRRCAHDSASFTLIVSAGEGTLTVGSAMECFEASAVRSVRRVATGCTHLRLVDAVVGRG